MTDVIIKTNPFSIYQSVYIKTPTKVETDKIELNKLNNFLLSLPADAVVQLVGSEKFLNHFVEKYREEEKTKYDKRHLTIYIRGIK